jgi:hypothetical protein
VTVGPQDPILAALHQAHVIAPFPEQTDVVHLWRVQMAPHAQWSCVPRPPCISAVLLDTLR